MTDRDAGTSLSIAAPSIEPSLSGDGRRVAFTIPETQALLAHWSLYRPTRVGLQDPDAGTHTPVSVASDGSEGNGPSQRFSVSGDGRFVVYDSAASNLVADDTNGVNDVFIWLPRLEQLS